MAILTSLSHEPRTSSELATALELDGALVRRRLLSLMRAGQVRRLGDTRRGGRVERLYLADPRASVLGPGKPAGPPRRLVDEACLALLRFMFREASGAIDAGVFGSRAERATVRLLFPLDKAGLREAVELQRRLVGAVIEEVERARGRLAASGTQAIAISIFILFFDHPFERWPPLSLVGESPRRTRGADRVDKVLALTDPLRSRLVDVLSVTPASAADLARRLSIAPSKARYELDQLLADGLVDVARTKRSRGTVERFFVLDPRATLLSAEDVAGLEARQSDRLDRWLVRSVIREALEAIRVESPRDSEDLVVARIPAAVDEEGFVAISAAVRSTVDALLLLRDRCLANLEEDEEPAHTVISGMLLFERDPADLTGLLERG